MSDKKLQKEIVRYIDRINDFQDIIDELPEEMHGEILNLFTFWKDIKDDGIIFDIEDMY